MVTFLIATSPTLMALKLAENGLMLIFLIYVFDFNLSSLNSPDFVGMCLCFREIYRPISVAPVRVQMCVSLSRFGRAGTTDVYNFPGVTTAQIHQQSCLQEHFQVSFRLSKPESV